MNILILSPTPERLTPTILSTGDTLVPDYMHGPDLAISYNHPRLVTPAQLVLCPHINLHISLLPYNRGADPNFWSWFDGTPKGVTVHRMNAGLDTGPLLAQREAYWTSSPLTLATTYQELQSDLLKLFALEWTWLRTLPEGVPQDGAHSTYHRRSDLHPRLFNLLPHGWDTPVSIVEEMGREYHCGLTHTGVPH